MFLNPPLSIVASWPLPQGKDAPSLLTPILITMSIMTAMVVIAVTLRFYSRFIVSKTFGWDDGFILAALIGYIGFLVSNCVQIHTGLGMHSWEFILHAEWIDHNLKATYAGSCCLVFCLACTKLSILLFYRRIIFTPTATSKTMNWVLRLSIALVAAWGVTFLLLKIFMCHPVKEFWVHSYSHRTPPHACSSFPLFGFAYSDVFIDLWIILLPLPSLVRLNMDMRKRLQVIVLFSVGTCSLICGAIRLIPIYRTYRTYDISWNAAYIVIFTFVELAVAITCASVPAIRVLVVSSIKKYRDTNPKSTTSSRWTPNASRATTVLSSSKARNSGRSSRKDPWAIDDTANMDEDEDDLTQVAYKVDIRGGLGKDNDVEK